MGYQNQTSNLESLNMDKLNLIGMVIAFTLIDTISNNPKYLCRFLGPISKVFPEYSPSIPQVFPKYSPGIPRLLQLRFICPVISFTSLAFSPIDTISKKNPDHFFRQKTMGYQNQTSYLESLNMDKLNLIGMVIAYGSPIDTILVDI